ncbi:putative sodium/hydrogen exchanger family protein [Colletotrichum sublineola]|uniref:Putative sodium/hydrogen exchanger family protein n=1 Tax=Colletotrichum sublineola TaxID=1173701 RepID=A0A066X5R0_COLSU|nr:putative sodium/hydrogen exchanger family protein [Colletotrichum sublineola]
MATTAPSLAYHEPAITTIIVLSGLLLLLNGVNYGLDKLVYCGLVGGLSTSFKSLKANILLSTGVAITGIAVPIGLSFTLGPMVGASPLQAFAAGAALCSTSLGTTFTVLGTSGLTTTRMGVVLTSAAMMDDVVGLIMVQVVSNLGGSSGEFRAISVVRPVLVSLGFATLVPAACKLVVGPVTRRLDEMRKKSPGSKLDELLRLRQTALIIHTCWLFGLLVGGTFAGTSSLLAAYIAGATISWWDSEVPHLAARADNKKTALVAEASSKMTVTKAIKDDPSAEASAATSSTANAAPDVDELNTYNSGVEVYEHYYGKAVENVLKPFFFASIGFSVPITKMFTSAGKKQSKKLVPGRARERRQLEQDGQAGEASLQPIRAGQDTRAPSNASPEPDMPVSIYPACILGFAMVARGEIGYLISALAESTGVFSGRSGAQDELSEMFLIVTWAITLCTIVGPVCVGLLVNRVKRLET